MGVWVGLEVVQLGGVMVGLDRNWGQGLDLVSRLVQESRRGWGWVGWVSGGCTAEENEICFWNMHGQWNKTKGEGERARQRIIQRGWMGRQGGNVSDGSTGLC